MNYDLTPTQHDERDAMTGDRMAVLRVISALRSYREASKRLLAARYGDGECDRVALGEFADAIDEIEHTEMLP